MQASLDLWLVPFSCRRRALVFPPSRPLAPGWAQSSQYLRVTVYGKGLNVTSGLSRRLGTQESANGLQMETMIIHDHWSLITDRPLLALGAVPKIKPTRNDKNRCGYHPGWSPVTDWLVTVELLHTWISHVMLRAHSHFVFKINQITNIQPVQIIPNVAYVSWEYSVVCQGALWSHTPPQSLLRFHLSSFHKAIKFEKDLIWSETLSLSLAVDNHQEMQEKVI